MVITNCSIQIKNKDRVSVFVDKKYTFSLTFTQFYDQKLKVGQEIEQHEVEKYKKLSLDGKVFERALNYASLRPRSEYELISYLNRKNVDVDLQNIVIDRLTGMGFINDEVFCEKWVQMRNSEGKKSSKAVQSELMVKRVNRDIINENIAKYFNDTAALLKTIEQKQRQVKYQDKIKLTKLLLSRGYSYDSIKSALSGLSTE
jgi:regulatory protein